MNNSRRVSRHFSAPAEGSVTLWVQAILLLLLLAILVAVIVVAR